MCCVDGWKRDVGAYAESAQTTEQPETVNLQRDDTRTLDEIHDVIESKQVTASQFSLAQPRIVTDSHKSEHESNWDDVCIEVNEQDVSKNANVTRSYVVYKIKTAEDGIRRLKTRIVPHGNHDDEKDDIRKDSLNAPLFVIRLLLSLAMFFSFRIGTVDINGSILAKRSHETGETR